MPALIRETDLRVQRNTSPRAEPDRAWGCGEPAGVKYPDLNYTWFSEDAHDKAATIPVRIDGREDPPYVWFYAGKVYVELDGELTADDVRALANEKANQRRLQLEKAHALQAMAADLSPTTRRRPIPQDVKITVWQRDGGRCVECGSNEDLEFDHIIPVAMGGANTMRNLQLLCEPCNRRKGATLG